MNYRIETEQKQQFSQETLEKAFFPYKNAELSPATWSTMLHYSEVKSAILSQAEKVRLAKEWKATDRQIFREYLIYQATPHKEITNYLDCCKPWQKNTEESHINGENEIKDFAAEYPQLNFEFELGKVTDKTLILSAQKVFENTPIICKREAEGYIYFPGRRKGDSRYNTEKSFEIKDRCDLLAEIYKYCFFVTQTQNKKNRLENLKEDLLHIKTLVKYTIHKLTKKYDCVILQVFEAHKDGHSHSHFVIFHNYDEWESTAHEKTTKCKDGKIRKYVDSGIFYDIMHGLYNAGIMQIEKKKTEDAASYTRKYITKGFDDTLEKIAKMDSNEELSDANRKALLGFFLAKATKSRAYACSTKAKIKKLLEAKFSLAEIQELKKKHPKNEILYDYPTFEDLRKKSENERNEEKRGAREGARSAPELLENASTNFSCPYYTGLRFGTFGTIKKALGIEKISLKNCNTDKSKLWILGTKPIGCSGCAWIEIFRYANGEFSPWFDLPIDRLSDKEKILIGETFAINGYPRIGINPFTVDLRILSALFPDSPIDKYLKQKYLKEVRKVEEHQLNKKGTLTNFLAKPKKEDLAEYRYKFANAKEDYKKTHFDF